MQLWSAASAGTEGDRHPNQVVQLYYNFSAADGALGETFEEA